MPAAKVLPSNTLTIAAKATTAPRGPLNATLGPDTGAAGTDHHGVRRWVALAVAGLLLVAGFSGYRYFLGHGPAPQYRTARVERAI